MATTLATSTPGASTPHATDWGRYARVALATIVAATLANVLAYYLGDAIVGYDPQFAMLSSAIGIAIFTLVPAIGATLIYAVLLRFARRPARTFAIVAAVVFVVTTIPDFTYIPTVPGATGAQAAVLVVMHVVAAAIITGMLTTLAHPQEG